MAPNRRRLDLPPPAPIDLHELKTTQSMRTSLQNLYACLLCPLCNHTFRNPVTLPACAHSFCQECISDYACNSYECPACSLPIMLRGGRAGKFDQTNPQIETVASSFVNLCNALNAAPNQWWRMDAPTIDEESSSSQMVLQPGDNDERCSFVMPREDGEDGNVHPSHDEDEPFTAESQEDEVMEHHDNGEINEDIRDGDGDDDDATELFPSPDSLTLHRSCPLPSQSPGCSMIAPEASQLSSHMEEVCDNVVKQDKVVQMKPTAGVVGTDKVRVAIVSKLSPHDDKTLTKLQKECKIEIVDTVMDSEVIAVCGNAEMETGDGWLVGSTFPFLHAVALGARVMHVTYFHKLPLADEGDYAYCKSRVIGVGKSSDWMGPQRAVEVRARGEYLLEGYTLICLGDFDSIAQNSRRGGNDDQLTIYSKERIQTLLTLCGAKIGNKSDYLVEENEGDIAIGESGTVAFMVRPNPHSRDWRAARKEVSGTRLKDKPIICANWLLESIADYRCKDLNLYTQSNFK